MRAWTPGGRFTSDFEHNQISEGIDSDLKAPVGTVAEWWTFDLEASNIDPIYDTGNNYSDGAGGKIWKGPFTVPVVRAVITQGSTKTSQVGFYNSDTLHLTLNAHDITALDPMVMLHPDNQDRNRIVWQGQVYRPFSTQQRGIISEKYSLLVLDCIQVMPEEMVNDPQFLGYSDHAL